MKNNHSIRRDSKTIINLKAEFANIKNNIGESERQAAKLLGVPRSTLRTWNQSKNSNKLSQIVIDFFNTPDGFDFLHVLMTAVLFVVNKISKSGVRMAQLIFEITGISDFAACSYGKLQQDAGIMDDNIIEFEVNEKARLSQTMKRKTITIAKDETEQKGKPHLIAIEPVSNFIIAEACSDKRDAESWNNAMKEGLSDLNVEVIQSTSDEGSAIKKYRETYLEDVNHSPDLFHIQHEIHKATAGPLASKRGKHEKLLEKAQQKLSRELQQKRRLENKSKNKSLDNKINKISKAILASEETVKNIQAQLTKISHWKSRINQAVATISQVYHPYDMTSGYVQTVEQINDCLEKQFAEIIAVAKAMLLSQKCLNRIEKAHRLVPQMTVTAAFYYNTIDAMIDGYTLSPEVEGLIKNQLIPIDYLKMTAEKMQTAEDKHAVRAVYKNMNNELEKNSTWTPLDINEKLRLENIAKVCAEVFQRSSSCVEGRNSHLGLWYHGVNHLNEQKRKSIKIIHNYYIKRSDGTTAAERFFGKSPSDLFLYLLETMPYPARPRNRFVAQNDEEFAMAA